MRVYVLHFRNSAAFTRAFDSVMDARDVASCLFEPEHGRIRFLAPRKTADELVEFIYSDGGLVWCSQHDLTLSNKDAAARLRQVDDGG
jgi:hypothetical protein